METVKALKLYGYSLNKHGSTSPFIYPLWGLGGLPEGFTRYDYWFWCADGVGAPLPPLP